VIGCVSYATGERIGKPYFVPEEEWGEVLADCKEELSALDEVKPLCKENSCGKHYGNELFFYLPIEFNCDGDSFVWAMLSRRFSSDLIPKTKKELERRFWKELEIFSFPEEDYIALKLPSAISPLAERYICRSSMERVLMKLKKNYTAYKERMEQLK
jgi:hypothetical protein